MNSCGVKTLQIIICHESLLLHWGLSCSSVLSDYFAAFISLAFDRGCGSMGCTCVSLPPLMVQSLMFLFVCDGSHSLFFPLQLLPTCIYLLPVWLVLTSSSLLIPLHAIHMMSAAVFLLSASILYHSALYWVSAIFSLRQYSTVVGFSKVKFSKSK